MQIALVVDRAEHDSPAKSTGGDGDLFVARIADRAAAAARSAGHLVDVVDLVADRFCPVLDAHDRRAYFSDTPVASAQVESYVELVRGADALVFVYPTTLSTVTPLLKGWIDRTLVPGVAFTMDDQDGVRRGLSNVRRIVGISTYDESWSELRRSGDNGRRLIQRNIRLCGGLRTRSKWIAVHRAAAMDETQREHVLARVEYRMARL